MLVLPVNLAKINVSKYEENGMMPTWAYGDVIWRGAYALNIAETGISVKGKITHFNESTSSNREYWDYDYNLMINRALYMDDNIYTISTGKIKANSISTMDEINSLSLIDKNIYIDDGVVY